MRRAHAPLRAADLRRYIRSHYRADNTIIGVAGSFDSGEAIKHCRAIKANAFFWDVFSREEIEKAVCRYPEISKKEER